MEPIVHGLETEFKANVAFDQVDATSERGQAAMKSYALRGHPSYVLLNVDGEELWQLSGQVGEDLLRAQLALLEP